MWPCQPSGRPEQLRRPVADQAFELGRGRRRAPQERDRVERGGQQLGEDPRARRRVGEVGEEARVLPVRHARHEHLVEVAQDGGERLALLGRRGRQARADVARLDLGEHRQLADALEVALDPLERGVAVVEELAHAACSSASRLRAAASAASEDARHSASRSVPRHRRGHRALHHPGEVGAADLVEARLRAVDRRLQRADPTCGLRGLEVLADRAGGVRRGLPLADEVDDRLRVGGRERLVEPLHERLRVAARVVVGGEVGVHALGRLAEQLLEVAGRQRAGRLRDRLDRGGRLTCAGARGPRRALVLVRAGALGDEPGDPRLQLVQLGQHRDDLAHVVGVEDGELGLERRLLLLDRGQAVAQPLRLALRRGGRGEELASTLARRRGHGADHDARSRVLLVSMRCA